MIRASFEAIYQDAFLSERVVQDLHGMAMNHKRAENRRHLRVLMVEDSQADAVLLARALERGGFDTEWERVDTAEALQRALSNGHWDLIFADHKLPSFSAPEALRMVNARGLDVPFIIVSGHIDEETAVAAMRSGAHDYVMKDRLARLVPVVERELREAQVRHARARSEEELRRAREELEMRVEQRTAALKAANQKLQDAIEERRRLENELLEIAENERRRIGFDLHDDLGQKLTGAGMMLKGLSHKLSAHGHPCASDAQKIVSLFDELIEHTHNLAHNFSSFDIEGDDLPGVLKDLAANVKKTFGLPCVFGCKGNAPALPENTTLQLRKIAQEAVSNAVKHGKAKHVSIQLVRQPEQLVMTVKNDGLPFATPNGPCKRMGLRIMNFRANTIGATLEIQPQGKHGTIVTCSLPLRPNGTRAGRRSASEDGARAGRARSTPVEMQPA